MSDVLAETFSEIGNSMFEISLRNVFIMYVSFIKMTGNVKVYSLSLYKYSKRETNLTV